MGSVREHLVRRVAFDDLSYWLGILRNDGWELLSLSASQEQVIVVGERRCKGLEWRLHDELCYARELNELASGLAQLLAGAARAGMPLLEFDLSPSSLHFSLRVGQREMLEFELTGSRASWPIEGLAQLFLFADNTTDLYKVKESEIRAALQSEDAFESLLVLLSGRAIIQSTPRGKTMQISRADLGLLQRAGLDQGGEMLTLQSQAHGELPWLIMGAEGDCAASLAQLLPGMVEGR